MVAMTGVEPDGSKRRGQSLDNTSLEAFSYSSLGEVFASLSLRSSSMLVLVLGCVSVRAGAGKSMVSNLLVQACHAQR